MTTKEKVLNAIGEMPETATWSDIEDRIRFLAALEKGLEGIREGRLVPHDQVKESLESWLPK